VEEHQTSLPADFTRSGTASEALPAGVEDGLPAEQPAIRAIAADPARSRPAHRCHRISVCLQRDASAGRSRQWLGAVPAASIWTARQSLPLRRGGSVRSVSRARVGRPALLVRVPTPNAAGRAAEGSPARRPVSRVLYRGLRRGDGHPSGAAGCPTAHAADPRAGQRASPPGEPGLRPPIWPCSGWSLPRFTPAPRGRHRHCGTGPRLTADGRYPPPCAGELGLSSRRTGCPGRRATIRPPRWPAKCRRDLLRGPRTAGPGPPRSSAGGGRCACRSRTGADLRRHRGGPRPGRPRPRRTGWAGESRCRG